MAYHRKNTTKLQRKDEVMERNQIWFTNLQLLGFPPLVLEKQFRIPFNKDMFNLPNKTAFEHIFHFLFKHLDSGACATRFHGCWPIRDKKSEQQFRRACYDWMLSIAKNDSEFNFPMILPTLFMTPGGEKFQRLLFSFSSYVLKNVCMQKKAYNPSQTLQFSESSVKNEQDRLAREKVLKAAITEKRLSFVSTVNTHMQLKEQWQDYAAELVQHYRQANKKLADLKKECQSLGIETKVKGKSSGYGSGDSIFSSTQQEQMKQVKENWQKLNDILRDTDEQRDVVLSVIDDKGDKPRLDAADIAVQIPEKLLRDSEGKIREKKIRNPFEGGKLNLISLVQLFNLALEKYMKYLESGVQSMCTNLPHVESQLLKHNAHLSGVKSLCDTIETKAIPEIEDAIRIIREAIQKTQSSDVPVTPQRGNATLGQGLSLNQATPPVNVNTTEVFDAPASTPPHNPTRGDEFVHQIEKGYGIPFSTLQFIYRDYLKMHPIFSFNQIARSHGAASPPSCGLGGNTLPAGSVVSPVKDHPVHSSPHLLPPNLDPKRSTASSPRTQKRPASHSRLVDQTSISPEKDVTAQPIVVIQPPSTETSHLTTSPCSTINPDTSYAILADHIVSALIDDDVDLPNDLTFQTWKSSKCPDIPGPDHLLQAPKLYVPTAPGHYQRITTPSLSASGHVTEKRSSRAARVLVPLTPAIVVNASSPPVLIHEWNPSDNRNQSALSPGKSPKPRDSLSESLDCVISSLENELLEPLENELDPTTGDDYLTMFPSYDELCQSLGNFNVSLDPEPNDTTPLDSTLHDNQDLISFTP